MRLLAYPLLALAYSLGTVATLTAMGCCLVKDAAERMLR